LELNNIIDKKLPASRPSFSHGEIVVAGEVYDVYYRNIIECIRELFGNSEFDEELILKPERHYEDASMDKDKRLYHDMHTGRWWWDTQVSAQ
jgi:hypothetical protein